MPREFAYGREDFDMIARLLEERAGIHLPSHKEQLVYARLAKRLRALGLASFRAYRDLLAAPEGAGELLLMVNALTTNLTRFFREPHHFEHLAVALKARIALRGSRRLRLWSAGCSTGQEPYSMAMTLVSVVPEQERTDTRILATDIDTDVLAIARAGRYLASDAGRLAAEHRHHLRDVDSGHVEVSSTLRELVRFKPLNLVGPWPMRGSFDAIFCRNVAIYFRHETQASLFARFRDLLAPDGFLYIGHSETLHFDACGLELVGQTIYRPR